MDEVKIAKFFKIHNPIFTFQFNWIHLIQCILRFIHIGVDRFCLACSNLSEIWHTYSLGESLGVLFSFFENFDVWGWRPIPDLKSIKDLRGALGKP